MPLLRTSLLKAEPGGTLHSLDELFALANALEHEAATRYAGLAVDMRGHGRADLADVFERLAAAEREHVESVTRWSQARRGKPPDPTLVRWEGPETVDADTAVEITTSRLMTPYRALAMAVRNEERAFAFWSYVAAYAEDQEIKSAAEAMAREELGHVAILRRERRRAYHSERDAKHAAPGEADHIDAAALERALLSHLVTLEGRLDEPGAARVRALRHQTAEAMAAAAGVGRFPRHLAQDDAQVIAEALVDAYLDGAETADDPARLEALQKLAETAIARLAWLRTLSPDGA